MHEYLVGAPFHRMKDQRLIAESDLLDRSQIPANSAEIKR